MAKELTADLDYKGFYHKHIEEISHLQMKLADSEERNRNVGHWMPLPDPPNEVE